MDSIANVDISKWINQILTIFRGICITILSNKGRPAIPQA